MATPRRTFRPSTVHCVLAALALGLAATAAGCATPIRAGHIPPEFQAPPTTNIQETGLRNLAVPKFNSQMIETASRRPRRFGWSGTAWPTSL
jgi:hypothetical protein